MPINPKALRKEVGRHINVTLDGSKAMNFAKKVYMNAVQLQESLPRKSIERQVVLALWAESFTKNYLIVVGWFR